MVLGNTYCGSGILTSVRENESTASGVSIGENKKATIQYKPVMSLAGNNIFTHYEQSHGYDLILHALGCTGAAINLLDGTSVYSLNSGKLPSHFSYKQPGYKAIGVEYTQAAIGCTTSNQYTRDYCAGFPSDCHC